MCLLVRIKIFKINLTSQKRRSAEEMTRNLVQNLSVVYNGLKHLKLSMIYASKKGNILSSQVISVKS